MKCPECSTGELQFVDDHFAECGSCGSLFSAAGVGAEKETKCAA